MGRKESNQTNNKGANLIAPNFSDSKSKFKHKLVSDQSLHLEELLSLRSGTICLLSSAGPTLKIFLFPLTRPCFTGMGRSVGKLFFLTSQIGYPLNLIVYSKTCLKRPLKKDKKCLFFQEGLSHHAGQKYCSMLPGSILQHF